MSNNNIDNDPSQRQKNKHMKIFLDDLTTLVDFPSKQIAGHCSFVPSVYQWEVIVNVATSANDQKKVTTDIYRHGIWDDFLLWTLNWMNERKGGERDTESSVASSFKLEADQLKIGCSDLQFWALSCWDYDESETLHFPLYCPFWVLTLECAFWDKEWEWQISECRANQRPVFVSCDQCWPISWYLTVEVCLCTGQLSYKEQVKPHSSWDWRGFKLLMKVTESPFVHFMNLI